MRYDWIDDETVLRNSISSFKSFNTCNDVKSDVSVSFYNYNDDCYGYDDNNNNNDNNNLYL